VAYVARSRWLSSSNSYALGYDRIWLGGYVGNVILSLRQIVHILIGEVVYKYARDALTVEVMQ
jgi:hypothetical protein